MPLPARPASASACTNPRRRKFQYDTGRCAWCDSHRPARSPCQSRYPFAALDKPHAAYGIDLRAAARSHDAAEARETVCDTPVRLLYWPLCLSLDTGGRGGSCPSSCASMYDDML
jgi:hypothetical protein